MSRGRPRILTNYVDILRRISEGIFEVDLRSGDGNTVNAKGERLYSDRTLRHYLKKLSAEGMILTDSHQTTGLTKAWQITEKGKARLYELEWQIRDHDTKSLRGYETASLQELPFLPPSRGRFIGVHNDCYKMVVIDPGTLEKFLWDGEARLNHWTRKFADINGMAVALNGKPGDQSITVNVAQKADYPYEADWKCRLRVDRLATLLEEQYHCHLGRAVRISTPKYEVKGDKVVEETTRQGLSIHSPQIGVDKTPFKEGTGHFSTAERVEHYLNEGSYSKMVLDTLPEQTSLLAKIVKLLEENQVKTQAMGEALVAQMEMTRKLVEALGIEPIQGKATESGMMKKTDKKEGYG